MEMKMQKNILITTANSVIENKIKKNLIVI